jgi:hypothetical protein
VAGVRFEDTRGTSGSLAADLVVDASATVLGVKRFRGAMGVCLAGSVEDGEELAGDGDEGDHFGFSLRRFSLAEGLEDRIVVESKCGAVTLGRACLFPPLSSGGALVAQP